MAHHREQIVIQDAEPSDSQAIRQLALAVRIDAWSETDYADEMLRSNSIVLKAMDRGELVGFLVARIVPGATERPDAELYNIAVLPTHKRHGIGSKLLMALVRRSVDAGVSSIWLEVREFNSEAISFYELHGFKAEATRPNFYTDPTEGAVIMGLPIALTQDVSEA